LIHNKEFSVGFVPQKNAAFGAASRHIESSRESSVGFVPEKYLTRLINDAHRNGTQIFGWLCFVKIGDCFKRDEHSDLSNSLENTSMRCLAFGQSSKL